MTCSHGVPETTLARGGSGHHRASAGGSVSSFVREPGAPTTILVKQGRVRDTAAMRHDQTTTAADGTRIAWSRAGSGEPVVLVHGITESAASFEPVTALLAATHEVITLDLRGHGESASAGTYDLAAMAGDVAAVCTAAGASRPHLVGHSLGGAVVTAAGSMLDVASVVDIDQSLQLDSFKAQLAPAEAMLRDPEQYQLVVDAMFEMMMGELLPSHEQARIAALRRADHDVVLGVWELLLTRPVEEIAATVDAALAGYDGRDVPYLAVFGLDPGDGYAGWLAQRIPGSVVEYWADHGHYPHLVDPERFVTRLRAFWTD
jgi:pimeloyl-ACP methyl ester carboxylesterase